ncbi:MAG: protein-tyrosine kinase [Gammaproteobacteria bacterium]|jgi:protein-tyrosine kinase
MTSIERAMDKIERTVNPSSAELTTDSDLPAPIPEVATKPLPELVDLEPESAVDVPSGDVAPLTAPRPKLAAAVSNAAATSPTRNDNFVLLQEDALSAGGFLTPNGARTRQQEEYQQIKRRLLANMVPEMMQGPNPSNLVMVTSSVPGEGKTFTSSNLAISIAMEIDHTVLAVDTDIIKSDMSGTFGLRNRLGLFDLLGDPSLRMEDVLVRTSIPNLVVLPAGTYGQSSTEYLASAYMKELLAEMAHRYPDRVILFDSPPLLATTTAAALARHVGQLLIVVESGKTKQETLNEALKQVEGIPVTGLILNKSKQTVGPGYGYYGYYGYESSD